MKKHNFILAAAFLMLMLFGFQSKAQNFSFTNSFQFCDVLITYEMTDPSNGCQLCSGGQIPLSPGQTVNVPICTTGPYEICVVINEIDNLPITTNNHATLSQCHLITNYGQSGPCSNNCSGGTYTALHSTTGWNIW